MASIAKVRLNINKISPGMKLAEPITNPAGITLMPAGIRLTPMFIARIKKWNVEELDVFVEKTKDTERAVKATTRTIKPDSTGADAGNHPGQEKTLSVEEEKFARSTAIEVSRPFVNLRDNPVMMQLRAAVIRRLIMHGPEGTVNRLRKNALRFDESENR